MNWNNIEVLITGGTGSLGKALVKLLVEKYKTLANPGGIRVFSRDELKQWEMKQSLGDLQGQKDKINISFLVGDIRDRKRVELATKNVDIIIHAAALKQIGSCENNPLEAINTNIIGAQNVLYAALENNVKKVMAISTDKACYPINLYGATKLAAEKLFINGNTYSGGRYPKLSCVRYGNVLGSRGSVVPLFKKQFARNGKVTITDKSMTRFWITLSDVAKFILESIENMQGGEIFIPKMGSANITVLLEAIIPGHCEIETIGIRPGEKLHEILITKEESLNIKEFKNYYVITDKPIWEFVPFEYTSNGNDKWFSFRQIRKMING